MEERNPPLPSNFGTWKQLQERCLLDRSSTEKKPDDRPLLPPNYVSLRQLRERRLKEEQEKEKGQEEMVKTSDNRAQLPPNYITVTQLEEQLLKEAKEREKKEKRGNGDGKEEKEEEESGDRPLLPPNYISLRQLQAQRVNEGKERRNEEREEEKVKDMAREEGENYPILPPNFVSLKQLKELRLAEKEQEGAKGKARLQRTKVQEGSDGSGRTEEEVNSKLCYQARKLPSRRPHMKVRSVWFPVLSLAGTGSSTGTSLADALVLSENAGVCHKAAIPSSNQNGDDAVIEPKKKRKKENRKRTSDKGKDEQVKGPECSIEATDLKNGKPFNASGSATKEMVLSQHKNNAVRKVKGEKTNITESDSQSITVCVGVKKLNGAPSRRFKTHRNKDIKKAKVVILSEAFQNVVSMDEVVKGCDGVKELIGTKIETSMEQKGQGKMVNTSESSEKILSHAEAKVVHGAGDSIGSEIESSEVKESGRNVNLPEPSPMGGQLGNSWRKKNQAAGGRGRSHPRAGRFPVRPAEHVRGGGLMWVPKKKS